MLGVRLASFVAFEESLNVVGGTLQFWKTLGVPCNSWISIILGALGWAHLLRHFL